MKRVIAGASCMLQYRPTFVGLHTNTYNIQYMQRTLIYSTAYRRPRVKTSLSLLIKTTDRNNAARVMRNKYVVAFANCMKRLQDAITA